jgi:hypothetical protein
MAEDSDAREKTTESTLIAAKRSNWAKKATRQC